MNYPYLTRYHGDVMQRLMDLPPGLYPGVPPQIYHAKTLGLINKGALDQIARTPMHYRRWVDAPEAADTPALTFGRAFHELVLEPDAFPAHWCERPDCGDLRTKKGKEAMEEWKKSHEGMTPINSDDWTKLHGMREAVLSHDLAGMLLAGSATEVTALWIDFMTNLKCKARFDVLTEDGYIVDLKTTQDASPEAFARSVATYRYHVQGAHYSAGFTALGHRIKGFCFIAVEKSAPYGVCVYQLDGPSRMAGERLRGEEMALMSRCMSKDEWPSWEPKTHLLSLPKWAM